MSKVVSVSVLGRLGHSIIEQRLIRVPYVKEIKMERKKKRNFLRPCNKNIVEFMSDMPPSNKKR